MFVYATANDVTSLPAELLRKGRFDEMFSVSLPNDEERKEIFTIHLTKKGRKSLLEDGTLNMSRLVIDSDGYSGAEIEACITEGLYTAFDEGRELKMSDVLDAIDHMTPLSQTMAEKLTKLNEWCRHRTRPASSIVEKPSLGRSVEAN